MRRTLSALGVAGALLAAAVAVPTAAAARDDHRPERDRATQRPIVIAHRGASGYRPEHTLEAYRLAIRQGADYIEPDLVATRDGVLVARHENEISGTTDVAARPEFAARRTTKTIDGVSVTGWFTEDFTLAELKTLRAKERLPQVRVANTAFDGRFEVPTFQEVVDLARTEGRSRGRVIGVYPETKHPTYFASIGLPLEEPLVEVLRRNRLTHRSAPVVIQSFETGNLRKLNRIVDVKLAQLLDATGRPYDFAATGDGRTYADLATPAGLKWIAGYADGIGANKNLIVPRDATGKLAAPTTLVRDAHREKLTVHAWTFRAENQFLPADFRIGADPNARGDVQAEYELFFGLGVDGVFSDHPDTAVAARAGLPRR
ncbi:glycerophosphodiester phosphodiesterase [Micromonospora endolithica]|uniref:glycerophosphodiester phosphodiesterase n=1 Tax=Micromonospora endolithica TaxID=230091 RepID=A0A3A9Z8T8_9ACTN|nr:glycerophosphodiester phosphodiesterase [Micromonospora endolithica]RKN44254.1 glycerophosphodiester phosphodiesterase [Micromonospora endolithica]TWJ25722.1 glycerophosphoryl diester phosphodiesterase [Micromonospora endolithica]